jgi:hypothetical protein
VKASNGGVPDVEPENGANWPRILLSLSLSCPDPVRRSPRPKDPRAVHGPLAIALNASGLAMSVMLIWLRHGKSL